MPAPPRTLPRYRNTNGLIVEAGRIKRICGAKVDLSCAPVGGSASESTGYPLIPVYPPYAWREAHPLKLGDVMIIFPGPSLEVVPAHDFMARFPILVEIDEPVL